MKKMKKAVALLLGCVMLTSLVLCACNKVADFGGNYTSGHSETEEMFTAPSKLNPDNLAKAQEYCSSVDPKRCRSDYSRRPPHPFFLQIIHR